MKKAVTPGQRRILESLSKKKKPVRMTKLAIETGYCTSKFKRTLKPLKEKNLVLCKQSELDKREKLVSITQKGRDWLRFNPDLTKGFQPNIDQKKRSVDYTHTHLLWEALGLETVTLSANPYTIQRGRWEEPIHVKGLIKNYRSYQAATREVHMRRGHSNVYFCPAETGTKGRKKVFHFSKALWLDIDFKKNSDSTTVSNHERQQRLNEILQKISDDNILVSAIVDSGNGFHLYFFTQNKITDSDRLSLALKKMAKKYDVDTSTAIPHANLRVPVTKNIKESDYSYKSVKKDCKLIHFNPKNLNRLSYIESVIGYSWDEIRRNQWQQQKDGKPDSTSENTNRKPSKKQIMSKSDLWHLIKHGYKPKGKDKSPSARDFFIMSECIRHGWPKHKIFKIFTNPENDVALQNHPDGQKHDEGYLEITYRNAFKAVHGYNPYEDAD